jgi:hypothetical protein
MKIMILMAAGITALLGVRTSEASSWTSGNVCSTELFTPPVSVSNDPWGATNPSTTSPIAVNCPLADASGGITKIHLLAYDRSTASNVCCSVTGFDTSGNVVVSMMTLCTTGSAAGIQDVSIGLPSNSARIWTARCMLPAAGSVNANYSHVVAIGLL